MASQLHELRRVQEYQLGDFRLSSGEVLPSAKLVYATYGSPNCSGTNTILYPTFYNGTHEHNELSIGVGRSLDPSRFHIVVPNNFGNGLSSSPSNINVKQANGQFPNVTVLDNVRAQYRLLKNVFRIESLALVTGFSLGGMIAFQWAVTYPDFVKAIVPICSETRVSLHNSIFVEQLLKDLESGLTTDRSESKGRDGRRSFARTFADWAIAEAFYQRGQHLLLGYSDLESFLVNVWDSQFMNRDPKDLQAMLYAWHTHDVRCAESGNMTMSEALARITAKCLILASSSDRNFPLADAMSTAALIPNGEYRNIPSVWGHRSGAPEGNREDRQFVDLAIRDVLDSVK